MGIVSFANMASGRTSGIHNVTRNARTKTVHGVMVESATAPASLDSGVPHVRINAWRIVQAAMGTLRVKSVIVASGALIAKVNVPSTVCVTTTLGLVTGVRVTSTGVLNVNIAVHLAVSIQCVANMGPVFMVE